MKKVHLSREQRYTISAMLKQGCTQKMIADAVGRDRSVISRELKRNAGNKGSYSLGYARDMAELRKERMKKPRKLLPHLKKEIPALIEQDRSPQQAAGRLKLKSLPGVRNETICKIIRQDKKWRRIV